MYRYLKNSLKLNILGKQWFFILGQQKKNKETNSKVPKKLFKLDFMKRWMIDQRMNISIWIDYRYGTLKNNK